MVDFILQHKVALEALDYPLSKYSLAFYPVVFKAISEDLAMDFGKHLDSLIASISSDDNAISTDNSFECENSISFLSDYVDRRERCFSSQ